MALDGADARSGICGVVAAALLHTVPDAIDIRLTPLTWTGTEHLIPFPLAGQTGGGVTRRLDLHAGDLVQLSRIDELRLMFDGYGSASRLLLAELSIPGGCRFESSAATLRSRVLVLLRRTQGCTPPAGPGRATLTLRFVGTSPRESPAGLWVASGGPQAAPVLFVEDPGTSAPVGRATQLRSPARIPRIALLAFMWNVSARQLWIRLAIASLALIAGAAFAGTGSTRTGAVALSAFGIAAGLAMCYAVIVPPLQAPDEPDHLLSFGVLTGRAELQARTAAWARQIHFDRIAFRPDERFTAADRDLPYSRAWPEEVFAEDVARRSSTATRYWQLIAAHVPSAPAHAVLWIRFADSVVFGAAFAAGAAAIASAGLVTAPAVLAPLLLSIPTLPFFGVHVSELTFNVVAFLLLAYATVGLLGDSRSLRSGLSIGLAGALIAAGTRSGWPMVIVVAALLFARAVTRRADVTTVRTSAAFWIGAAAPVLLLFGSGTFGLPAPAYDQWQLPPLDPRIRLGRGGLLAMAAIVAAGGFVLERVTVAWQSRRTSPSRLLPIRIMPIAGAAWIAGTLAASLWIQWPRLPSLENQSVDSAAAYTSAALAAVLTGFRLTGFDFLTWTSFWGAFGWADTNLPWQTIAALTLLAGVSAISLLVSTGRAADWRRPAILTLCGLAFVATIAAYAVSSYGLHRNLHGRYVLGPYLVAIAALCAGPALLPVRRLTPAARASLLLALMLAIHAFSIGFLLDRYFG